MISAKPAANQLCSGDHLYRRRTSIQMGFSTSLSIHKHPACTFRHSRPLMGAMFCLHSCSHAGAGTRMATLEYTCAYSLWSRESGLLCIPQLADPQAAMVLLKVFNQSATVGLMVFVCTKLTCLTVDALWCMVGEALFLAFLLSSVMLRHAQSRTPSCLRSCPSHALSHHDCISIAT